MYIKGQVSGLAFGLRRFSETPERSSEHGAIQFKSCVVADVEERVHSKEELIENLEAVVLVLVTASKN